MENGRISDTFEKTIFTTIAATGVISGIARGSNQTALAHKFYETTRFLFSERTKKFTHGEIVGVGLLLQNHFNAETENNSLILGLMKNYHLPSCIEDLGIDMNSEVFDAYYKKLCESSAIESEHDAERLKESMKYLWGVNSHDKSD
jgi:glycerol dehydrogenase